MLSSSPGMSQTTVTGSEDASDSPVSSEAASPSEASTGAAASEAPEVCPPTDSAYSDHVVVCVDATRGAPTFKVHNAPNNMVKPNRAFLVIVRHLEGDEVSVNLGGSIGTTEPGIKMPPREGDGGGGGMFFGGDSDEGPPVVVTSKTFAPRIAGQALNLVVNVGSRDSEPRTNTLEFFVETTYVGAIRVGVAGIFLGGLDATYKIGMVGNSQQAEIVAQQRPDVDVDIVVGYAAYFDPGGRGVNGCSMKPWCFAPYVGIGILSPTADGVNWLKSVHLGLEWEPVPNFSVAVTAAVRRAERLADGYKVGAPIQMGSDIPTRDAWEVGLGVVINVSPDLFKFAGNPIF